MLVKVLQTYMFHSASGFGERIQRDDKVHDYHDYHDRTRDIDLTANKLE